MFNLMVTGHRPNKISSDLYDVNSNLSKTYINFFKHCITEFIIKNSDKTINCISGMALGIDTLFAIAVLTLKKNNNNIKLHCAIPCTNHSSRWRKESVRVYNKIIKSADKVVIVTNRPYKPMLMQIRNQYMVDLANHAIAVWDRTPGGTANCVKYIRSKKVPVDVYTPISGLPAK